jgi:hypothetical protein
MINFYRFIFALFALFASSSAFAVTNCHMQWIGGSQINIIDGSCGNDNCSVYQVCDPASNPDKYQCPDGHLVEPGASCDAPPPPPPPRVCGDNFYYSVEVHDCITPRDTVGACSDPSLKYCPTTNPHCVPQDYVCTDDPNAPPPPKYCMVALDSFGNCPTGDSRPGDGSGSGGTGCSSPLVNNLCLDNVPPEGCPSGTIMTTDGINVNCQPVGNNNTSTAPKNPEPDPTTQKTPVTDKETQNKLDGLNLTINNTNNRLDGIKQSSKDTKDAIDKTNSNLNGIGDKLDGIKTSIDNNGSKLDGLGSKLDGIKNSLDKPTTPGTGLSTKQITHESGNFDGSLDTRLTAAKDEFNTKFTAVKTELKSTISANLQGASGLPSFDYGTIKGQHIVVDLSRFSNEFLPLANAIYLLCVLAAAFIVMGS